MRLFVSPQLEAVERERLLDFLDRLLAEVRDGGELVLGLADEVADRLDTDALQAVVGADAQLLELLDREVLHPVRRRRVRRRTGVLDRNRLAEALDLLEVGEDRQLAAQALGSLADTVARIERARRRDVEPELVVVGALTDTRGLHVVGDAADRREDRVDRDEAMRVFPDAG